MNPNGPKREEFDAGWGSGGDLDDATKGDEIKVVARSSKGQSPGNFQTFEEADEERTARGEEGVFSEPVPEQTQQFEPEALRREVFLSAKDISKSLEGSPEFQEMNSLVVRRENILVEITATQQEIIKVRSMVKRFNQELKDAEDIKASSLALANSGGEGVSQAVADSIEKVFAGKKNTIDTHKANLQVQFDRLDAIYANQKREFLNIEESINTIRGSLRSQLDKEISRIEVATNLEQEQGTFDILKKGYDESLEEMAVLEKQIELFKALKKIDKKGKSEFNAQIEKNEEKIDQIKSNLKKVEKDLVTAGKHLDGINKRIDSIEAIKKTKGIEEVKDFRSNQGSFEGFVFEDPVVEESRAQETPTPTQATSRKSASVSSGQTASGGGGGMRFRGGGRLETKLPKQTLGGKAKSLFNKFFSLWG